MPFTPLPLTNFVRGLVANTGRLSSPRGSVQRVSNLFYKNVGALTTVDGSLIQFTSQSALSSEVILRVGAYPAVGTSVRASLPLLALVFNPSTGNLVLYEILSTGTSAWTSLGAVVNNWQGKPRIPSMISFAQSVIITLGNSLVPMVLSGGTLTALTNSWTASGYAPAWTASTPEAVGNIITASSAIWRCIQAGTTGGAAPTWPSSGTVTDNSVIWKRLGGTSPGTPGAAYAATAGDALFFWGTAAGYTAGGYDGPDSLRQSDPLNPNSWNPANQVFVGQDGSPAMGLANMTIAAAGISPNPRLVLFKPFGTFEFLGLFPNATLVEAKSDMGCWAGNSVQFVAELGGVVRFTHRGFALYRGAEAGSDQVISDDIRQYIFGGASDITPVDLPALNSPGDVNVQASLSAVSNNPDLYLCAMPLQGGSGALTRVFVLDVSLMKQTGKPVWSVADLPWPITSMDALSTAQMISNVTPPLNQVAFANAVLISPTSGGSTDNTIRRWMAGDPDWDGTAINWSFKTPQLFDPKKPQSVFYFRNTLIGGTGAGKVTGVSLDYNNPANGAEQTATIPLPSAGLSIPASKSINKLNRGGALTISGTGQVVIEAVDVEVVPRGERPYAQS